MYRVVLADDHALVRHGLKRIITETGDIEVVGEAGDGLELLEIIPRLTPDMVILDISMPRLRGLEAIHEIKIVCPDAVILVLTMHKEKEYLYLALSSGAKGYVLKDDADRELFDAIAKVRQGRTYISPHFSDELLDDLVREKTGEASRTVDGDILTPREREVTKLVAEGRSSREIGELLSISARTVDNHRARIMEKLKAKKTTDLVKYALQKGYI